MIIVLIKITFSLKIGLTNGRSCQSSAIFITFVMLEMLFLVRILTRDIVTPLELIEINSSFVKDHMGLEIDVAWISSIIFDFFDFALGLLVLYFFKYSIERSETPAPSHNNSQANHHSTSNMPNYHFSN
jgi:hypothetical protein